jgi:hypothetical protein
MDHILLVYDVGIPELGPTRYGHRGRLKVCIPAFTCQTYSPRSCVVNVAPPKSVCHSPIKGINGVQGHHMILEDIDDPGM